MLTRTRIQVATLLLTMSFAGAALAGPPNPATSSLVVTYSQFYPNNGCYNPGQPKDYVTIVPDGSGDTFAGTGITIEVIVRDAAGQGCANLPAASVILTNPNLAICPLGNIADGPTNNNGSTTFSGTLSAGGCTQGTGLEVWAAGVFLGTIAVNTNSPDFAHTLTSPGFVDASDLAQFASVFGAACGSPLYDICYDFNEQGLSIDASDLAYFASTLGASW